MCYLRSLFGNTFWASVLALFMASVGVAQTLKGASVPMVIDETTAFAWPVMLLAVVSAGGYVTMVVTNRNHRDNPTIHRTEAQITENHPTREVCDEKHKALLNQLEIMQKTTERMEAKIDALAEKH